MPKIRTKVAIILELLIIIAVASRLLFSSTTVIYPDACTYLSISKSILNGKLSTDFMGGGEIIFPPLYPLITSAFYLVFRNLELSALIVSLLSGSLLIIPACFLTRSMYGERAAWFSSIFILFSPVMINWSVAMHTEALFILLFVSAITMGHYALERGKGGWFFAAGGFVGLTYLTRLPGIIALGVLAGWIIIYSLVGKFSIRKGITFIGLLMAGFFIIIAPYLIHLHSVFGEWSLTASYDNVTEVVMDEGADTIRGWEHLNAGKTGKDIFTKLIDKTSTNLRHYTYSLFKMLSSTLLFIVISIVASIRRLRLRRDFTVPYLLSFVVVYFLLLLILPLSPLIDERMRYLSPVLPLFLILASGGIIHIYNFLAKRDNWRLIKKAAIPAMMVVVFLSFIPQYNMVSSGMHKFWEEKIPVDMRKETGLWMKKTLPHPVRAMSRKPFIAYYADAIYFQTPATYEEVIRMAKENKIDYLIIDKIVDYSLRPKLRFLFNPALVPKDLKLIGGYTHPTTGEILIGVYRIER